MRNYTKKLDKPCVKEKRKVDKCIKRKRKRRKRAVSVEGLEAYIYREQFRS